jgi:pantoate--beta-alanine ligase
LFDAGEGSVDLLLGEAKRAVEREPSAIIEYVELLDGVELKNLKTADNGTLLALAVKIGKTRLIDNTLLGEEL